MIDVKKLVTGFLILAVAASAAALIISNIGDTTSVATHADGAAIAAVTAGPSDTSLTGSAFLPQSSATDDSITETTSTTPASITAIASDPNNLTNILANAYVNNLALTNPTGPATDGNGNPILTPPDNNSVISQFMASSSLPTSEIPNWDAEVDQVPVSVVSSSPATLTSYSTALGEILNANIIQPNIQGLLSNNTDPSFVPIISARVLTSLQDISSLKTPTQAVAFQRSLIKTLVYAKNILALSQTMSADPLKTTFIMQAEGTKYDAAVQDLQANLQVITSQHLFSLNSSAATEPNQSGKGNFLANIQALVGIPVVNAQGIPVIDATGDVGIWVQIVTLIKNQLNDIALQIVKNTLVFLMQKIIIAGIQGSGAPAFIQQWGVTLANAFQRSAVNALNSQMLCVGAAPFAPQLKLTLGATYAPGNNNVCAVQFQSQLANNLTKYYNNFSNGGGWVTYGMTLQPDNDYYGSAFFVAQAIGNTAQNSQNAAQAKSIAGQGFHGSAVCDDGSDPNGVTYNCFSANDSFYNKNANCPAGYQLQVLPNNGFCSDGTEPEVQTPGTTFNNMVNSALDGNFKLITSANSWVGLASGIFVSILQQTLNSLAQTTIASANGLLQQASNGGGANGVSGNGLNVTTPASSPQPITCYVIPNPTNSLAANINVSGGETVSGSGVTTPNYVWQQPAGGILSPATGPSVAVTFNATGTYPVIVTDTTDNVTQTCQVTVPAQ